MIRKTPMIRRFMYKRLPDLGRFVNLKEWVSVELRKPKKGQQVWICDADWQGWADYELPATFDGTNYIGIDGMKYQGMSFWQPRNERR